MRFRISVAVVCLWIAAATGPAQAQQVVVTEEPITVDVPRWASVPNAYDMSDAYPHFASWIDVGGWTQLTCVAALNGILGDCEVVKSAPLGLGFDRAALALTPRFRLSPLVVDGTPRKARVTFTIRFALPPEEPVAVWPGPEPSREDVAAVRAQMARMIERSGPPPSEILAQLDVDNDRREAVTRMVEQVERDFESRRLDALALAMTRSGTPDQIAAFSQGRRPPGAPPSDADFARASGELDAVGRDVGARIRARYCERYACFQSDIPTSPATNLTPASDDAR